MKKLILLMGMVAAITAHAAKPDRQIISATLEDCKKIGAQFAPIAKKTILIENNADMLMTKYCLFDGSVLLTCSRVDRKAVILTTNNMKGCLK